MRRGTRSANRPRLGRATKAARRLPGCAACWVTNIELDLDRSTTHGSPSEQEVPLAARHASHARSPDRSGDRRRADHRRNASAPSRQRNRLLSRQEGRQDQRRVVPLITVAVDCMGGDHGPRVTVPAALAFQARAADVALILVGRKDDLDRELNARGTAIGSRLRIQHASEVVEMNEAPAQAMRFKKDSSIRVAVNLVKSGEAHACVSAGNTGALMAISRFVLKTISGIDRPAIATVLPNSAGGYTYVLDLGANVDCTPEQLMQFGVMGAMLVAAVDHKERPSVGLLNIGVEDIKGNETVKQAGELLKTSGLNFYGNVEGDDIYKGTTDVVVCDGFVGNSVLKASEGVAKMLLSFLKTEFTRNPWRMFIALLARPVFNALRARMDPGRYNGASLLGLRGIVIKSHGSADAFAFGQALERAVDEVRNEVPQRIAQ